MLLWKATKTHPGSTALCGGKQFPVPVCSPVETIAPACYGKGRRKEKKEEGRQRHGRRLCLSHWFQFMHSRIHSPPSVGWGGGGGGSAGRWWWAVTRLLLPPSPLLSSSPFLPSLYNSCILLPLPSSSNAHLNSTFFGPLDIEGREDG